MSIVRKSVGFEDYITFYNELAFIIAQMKVAGERIFLLLPSSGTSRNKFHSSSKKILSSYKKEGVINAYIAFSELKEEKTASKYLLNLFPALSDEVNVEECGFIVKL